MATHIETCFSCKPSLMHFQHVALFPLFIYTHFPFHNYPSTVLIPLYHHQLLRINSPRAATTIMTDRDRTYGTAITADRDRPQQIHIHPRYEGGVQSLLPKKGPTASQVIALVTLIPIGGSLLGLAGIILVGTLIGLAVATPLFVICSPVLVPAAIMLAGAVTGFLTSGAFGLTGLSSLSWVFNSFRQATGQEPLEYAKRRMQEGIVQVGEKTKQAGEMLGEKTKQTGEAIKTKGHEAAGGGITATART